MTDDRGQMRKVARIEAMQELLVTMRAEADITTTNSIGLTVAQTFTLTRSELSDDQYHYELVDPDGNVVDSGVGNSLSDAPFGLAVGAKARETGDTDPDAK